MTRWVAGLTGLAGLSNTQRRDGSHLFFAPTRAEIFGRWAVMLSPFGQLEKKVAGVGRSRTHPETRRRPRNGFEDREDHQIPSTPKTARIICWQLSGYDY